MTAEPLLHYSAEPLGSVRSVVRRLGTDAKPNGLWLSVGPAWEEWCRGENWGIDRLRCVSGVRLRPSAKILRISSVRGIDRLTEQFAAEVYPGSGLFAIDWHKVARDYDGIIIAPYQWRRRLRQPPSAVGHYVGWYYGWDCASGCIWRARAISRIVPVTR